MNRVGRLSLSIPARSVAARRRLELAGSETDAKRLSPERTVYIAVSYVVAVAVASGFIGNMPNNPYVALCLAEALFILFLFFQFKSNFRLLFLLHLPLVLILSQSFERPFLNLGDGPAYAAVTRQYLNTAAGHVDISAVMRSHDILYTFKYLSLGVSPIFYVPEHYFRQLDAPVYYIWQNLFHLGLVSGVVALARIWRAVSEKSLLAMALFAAVGPSFFELGATPTRHVVTFFGVFLFFISYTATARRFRLSSALGLLAAGLVLAVSRFPLIAPALAFIVLDQLLNAGRKLSPQRLAIIAAVVIASLLLGSTLLEKYVAYGLISRKGADTFGFMATTPVVGPIVKVIYAILSPFPWSKASFFVDNTYGGNWFIFYFHVLSALFGLYAFMALALRARRFSALPIDVRQGVMYALLMSASVMQGATGFHTYILLYFPFLAPLVRFREFRISPLFPLLFVGFLELALLVASAS